MTDDRFDKYFNEFLREFGEPHDCTPIPESVIDAYRDRLPEQLVVYWRTFGACGFHNGLFWIVNPDEYQDLLDSWLEGTSFEQRTDLTVIGRTAFGRLYVWAKRKGHVISIDPGVNLLSYDKEDDENALDDTAEDKKMRYYFGNKSPGDFDDPDEHDEPLFARALKKLGPVKNDEMYGYSHRLAMGGKALLSNLEIVKLHVYHDIAQQMEPLQYTRVS